MSEIMSLSLLLAWTLRSVHYALLQRERASDHIFLSSVGKRRAIPYGRCKRRKEEREMCTKNSTCHILIPLLFVS